MSDDVVVVLVVATAFAFAFTNGFHDTAEVIATSISTKALPPRLAVASAAILTFAGAFISLQVAATIADEMVEVDAVTPAVVLAGLIGGLAWNLLTWYFGLPASSSHALIGGLVGSTIAAAGTDAVIADGVFGKFLIPAVLAPVAALVVSAVAILAAYRIVGGLRPGTVTRAFRIGQTVSGGLLALAHGTNDAQKTMGVITLALVAGGSLSDGSDVPFWVVFSAAAAIGFGTYGGGWRIIRTMGMRIIKMDAVQGFSAQSSSAAVILASSYVGFPLSTTHVISGGVIGAGAARRLPGVRWGVAGNIGFAWALTLPIAGGVGAAAYGVMRAFGTGSAGPVIVAVGTALLIAALFTRRARQGAPVPAG